MGGASRTRSTMGPGRRKGSALTRYRPGSVEVKSVTDWMVWFLPLGRVTVMVGSAVWPGGRPDSWSFTVGGVWAERRQAKRRMTAFTFVIVSISTVRGGRV